MEFLQNNLAEQVLYNNSRNWTKKGQNISLVKSAAFDYKQILNDHVHESRQNTAKI